MPLLERLNRRMQTIAQHHVNHFIRAKVGELLQSTLFLAPRQYAVNKQPPISA